MNRLLKTTILSAAVAATALAPLSANAGERWHRYNGRHHGSHQSDDLLAAGIIGLAVGALAVAATTQPAYGSGYNDRYVYDRPYPARRYYPAAQEPDVVYLDEVGAMEPWTREWYDYCSDRYATFNPRTGTFNGYDGLRHFCVAR